MPEDRKTEHGTAMKYFQWSLIYFILNTEHEATVYN